MPTSNPLARKLSHFAPLSEADRRGLDALAAPDEHFPADVDIVAEGSVPRSVFLLKEGMAIRYRSLPDGGRQIMTFLIPGDLSDMHVFLLKAVDHSIGTTTPVRVAPISRESMMDVFSNRPRISAALWWSSLQEEAMLRERIVSLGRRDARGRIAYQVSSSASTRPLSGSTAIKSLRHSLAPRPRKSCKAHADAVDREIKAAHARGPMLGMQCPAASHQRGVVRDGQREAEQRED